MQPSTQKNKNDKSNLQSIYPTPKSYEEIAKERRERRDTYEKRKPQHIITSTSLRLYTILIGIVLTVAVIPYLIRFNVITGVSLSFLIVSILIVYSLWMVNLISSTFYRFGFSIVPFLSLYTGAYITLLSLEYVLFPKLNIPTQIGIWTLSHFALVYVLITLILRSKTSD
jgi:uncharacterized membrane protein